MSIDYSDIKTILTEKYGFGDINGELINYVNESLGAEECADMYFQSVKKFMGERFTERKQEFNVLTLLRSINKIFNDVTVDAEVYTILHSFLERVRDLNDSIVARRDLDVSMRKLESKTWLYDKAAFVLNLATRCAAYNISNELYGDENMWEAMRDLKTSLNDVLVKQSEHKKECL